MANAMSKNFEKVCSVLAHYENDRNKLIPILQEIQDEYQYLPEDVMIYISTALGLSTAQIYGVATFYSHFTLEPKGKHIIKICDGTACHVKKSEAILKMLEEKLSVDSKKKTTEDGLFTLETVACLGACGLAPVVVIDEKVYGAMTPDKTEEIIDKIMKGEMDHATA